MPCRKINCFFSTNMGAAIMSLHTGGNSHEWDTAQFCFEYINPWFPPSREGPEELHQYCGHNADEFVHFYMLGNRGLSSKGTWHTLILALKLVIFNSLESTRGPNLTFSWHTKVCCHSEARSAQYARDHVHWQTLRKALIKTRTPCKQSFMSAPPPPFIPTLKLITVN